MAAASVDWPGRGEALAGAIGGKASTCRSCYLECWFGWPGGSKFVVGSAEVAPELGAPLPGLAVFVFLCDYLGRGIRRLGRGVLRGQGVVQWWFYWNGGGAAEC